MRHRRCLSGAATGLHDFSMTQRLIEIGVKLRTAMIANTPILPDPARSGIPATRSTFAALAEHMARADSHPESADTLEKSRLSSVSSTVCARHARKGLANRKLVARHPASAEEEPAGPVAAPKSSRR